MVFPVPKKNPFWKLFNGNFCKPGPSPVRRVKDGLLNFHLRLSAKHILFYFCQIRTVLEPVQGPCTMDVQNEPLHDMACVIKRGTPPNEGGNFVSLILEKAYHFWE